MRPRRQRRCRGCERPVASHDRAGPRARPCPPPASGDRAGGSRAGTVLTNPDVPRSSTWMPCSTRLPRASRPRCSTTSMPAPIRACTARRSSPAVRPSASSRAGTSAAEFACTVPAPPSCPVFMAASRSTTSAPRTSPRTSRSGRMRSACRTRSRRVTTPAPSTLAVRACMRTTCGWSGSSSVESSTMTSRWSCGIRPSSDDRTVVLPEPVPPLTRKASRAAIMARSRSAQPVVDRCLARRGRRA